MKKFIFSIITSLMMVISVSAQGVNATADSKFLDNTSVTVMGGATTPLTFNSVFPLNGVGGIKIAKDITPIVGVNIEGLASFGSAIDNGARYSYNNVVRGIYVGANTTLNLSNWICGYNPSRTFSVSTEHGIGWIHGFNSDGYGDDQDNFGAKTGVVLNFGLGKSKAWNVFAEPTIYWNLDADKGVKFNRHNALVGIEVGVTYRFKNSHGKHNFVKGHIYDDAYVSGLVSDNDRLRGEINSLNARVVATAKKYAKPTTNAVSKVEKIVVNKTTTVCFAKNSSELTESAKAILNEIPDNSVVSVKATASPEGSAEYNLNLSKARANVVADYLKSRGVRVTSAEGLGVVDNASNRVAVVVCE